MKDSIRKKREIQNTSSKQTRRNQFEIWAEILEACLRVGRTQSWLLREIRLTTESTKESLEFLTKANLIIEELDENQDLRCYITTDKGEEALNTFYKLVMNYFRSD